MKTVALDTKMKHKFSIFACVAGVILFMIFAGCQQKPTKIIEESAEPFEKNRVLLDTRSALDFASFHIEGSQNLLVEDFLILTNPMAKKRSQKRILDPDLAQVIERLAHKGVAPDKVIFLVGAPKDSVNNKKWKWLLNRLEIDDVRFATIEEISKIKNGRFAAAEKMRPWTLKMSEVLQKELIYKKSADCFVGWSEKKCN